MTLTRADLRAAAEKALKWSETEFRTIAGPSAVLALLDEADAADERARRFYKADGSFTLMATEAETIEARIAAAQRVGELEREIAAWQLAACPEDRLANMPTSVELIAHVCQMPQTIRDHEAQVAALMRHALVPCNTWNDACGLCRAAHAVAVSLKHDETLRVTEAAYRAKVRDEAIEECAKELDERADGWQLHNTPQAYGPSGRLTDAAKQSIIAHSQLCAAATALRALASAPPAEDGK